ncbi:MAG: nucleotidyltransferase family protein [Prochlorothrix sp.]
METKAIFRVNVVSQRRQQVWQVAQQAAQWLHDRYNVEAVRVFGSLLSDRFHGASDLDLGVWGLAPDRYWEAVGYLQGMGAIAQVAIDLVPAETATPALAAALAQGQLLSPRVTPTALPALSPLSFDAPMNTHPVLKAKIDQELSNLVKIIDITQEQAQKAQRTGDSDYYRAAALSLHNFYVGVERILEEIAKAIDGSLPQGANSHQALLEQMALNLPQLRPPVLRPETLAQLQPYRGFRHVLVHRYGFELEDDRIQALIDRLSPCWADFQRDIQGFLGTLEGVG